ncbi:MAG: TIGR03435 family protein [Candidatus Solibacter sp.]
MVGAQSGAKFEAVSVKPRAECPDGGGPRFGIGVSPGYLSVACQTVDFLIRLAYLANGRDPLFVSPRIYTQAIQGSPRWLSSEHYAVNAKTEGPQNRETMLGPMMRVLLEDRFRLRVHRETREAAVYELTTGRGGTKLAAAKQEGCADFDMDHPEPPAGTHFCGVMIRSRRPGGAPVTFYGATMADLARGLTRLLDREVIDRTGLAGVFDIRLELSTSDMFPLVPRASSGTDGALSAADPQGLTIFGAVDKLGLKLTPAKGTVEILVIDHVERPSKN